MRFLLRSLCLFCLATIANAQIISPVGFVESNPFAEFEVTSDGSAYLCYRL